MTVNEKLCDQLNKIIIFFVQVIALFLKVPQFEKYLAKHGSSRILSLDVRAIRGFTTLNSFM